MNRWKSLSAAVAALSIASAHARQDQTPQLRPPRFRSGVELVALNVSVVDPQQRFISGLRVEDFSVSEDGVPRDVPFFGAAGVPVDVGLLLDLSGSMRERIGVIVEAAVGFIRTLRPGDRAVVTGFADRMEILQSMTSDPGQLEQAVRQARPRGRTALYDTLYITAREMARTRTPSDPIRRQALVVLTDGADTSSLVDREDALAAVRRSGATVYTISPHRRYAFRSPLSSLRHTVEADDLLMTLAADTGGRAFFLQDWPRLPMVYAEIAAELFQQYTLAYEAEVTHGRGTKFRQLAVRIVTRPDAVVRTRRGYDPPRSGRR